MTPRSVVAPDTENVTPFAVMAVTLWRDEEGVGVCMQRGRDVESVRPLHGQASIRSMKYIIHDGGVVVVVAVVWCRCARVCVGVVWCGANPCNVLVRAGRRLKDSETSPFSSLSPS